MDYELPAYFKEHLERCVSIFVRNRRVQRLWTCVGAEEVASAVDSCWEVSWARAFSLSLSRIPVGHLRQSYTSIQDRLNVAMCCYSKMLQV
jgi:hypothetical protein